MNDVQERDNQAVASYGDNPFTAYGNEADRSGLPLLRFNQGIWVCGGSNETVAAGTQVLFRIDELEVGWRKWWGSAIVDTNAHRLIDGIRPAKRDELGDQDQSAWEMGLDGRTPKDPWEFFNAAPAIFRPGETPIDTDTVLCVGNSKGFFTAVGRVAKSYGERMRQHPDELPIVELHASRYYNKTYKRDVDVPEFKIVGWSGLDAWEGVATAPPAAQEAELPLAGNQGTAADEVRSNF